MAIRTGSNSAGFSFSLEVDDATGEISGVTYNNTDTQSYRLKLFDIDSLTVKTQAIIPSGSSNAIVIPNAQRNRLVTRDIIKGGEPFTYDAIPYELIGLG